MSGHQGQAGGWQQYERELQQQQEPQRQMLQAAQIARFQAGPLQLARYHYHQQHPEAPWHYYEQYLQVGQIGQPEQRQISAAGVETFFKIWKTWYESPRPPVPAIQLLQFQAGQPLMPNWTYYIFEGEYTDVPNFVEDGIVYGPPGHWYCERCYLYSLDDSLHANIEVQGNITQPIPDNQVFCPACKACRHTRDRFGIPIAHGNVRGVGPITFNGWWLCLACAGNGVRSENVLYEDTCPRGNDTPHQYRPEYPREGQIKPHTRRPYVGGIPVVYDDEWKDVHYLCQVCIAQSYHDFGRARRYSLVRPGRRPHPLKCPYCNPGTVNFPQAEWERNTGKGFRVVKENAAREYYWFKYFDLLHYWALEQYSMGNYMPRTRQEIATMTTLYELPLGDWRSEHPVLAPEEVPDVGF